MQYSPGSPLSVLENQLTVGGGGWGVACRRACVCVVDHPSVVCICLSLSLSPSFFCSLSQDRWPAEREVWAGYVVPLCEVLISLLVHTLCLSAQETATTHAFCATSLANDGVLWRRTESTCLQLTVYMHTDTVRSLPVSVACR